MSLSSYLSTRAEFESCLRDFYEETKYWPNEGATWTWETQSIVNTMAEAI